MQQLTKSRYKDKYDQEGIVFPVRVLTTEEVGQYKFYFEKLEDFHNGFLPRATWPHLFFDWAFNLVAHPAIVQIVEDFIGSEVIVEASMYLNKYPDSAAHFPWHQDGHRSKSADLKSTTVWLALSESNVENGCMRFIPKTHNRARMRHEEVESENSMLKYGGQITASLDESRARNVILKPGEMSVHGNNIIHGSLPNTSRYKRSGFIIRYSNAACQSTNPVLQVAGTKTHNHLRVIKETMTTPGGDPFKEHKAFVESKGEQFGKL